MGFSRQGYWCELPYPAPQDLPSPGIEPGSPELQQILYRLNQQENHKIIYCPQFVEGCHLYLLRIYDQGERHIQLMELAETQVHQVSDAIQPSHPLLSPFPPPALIFPRVFRGLFKWVRSLQQVPKYWSFNFSTSPSNEYSGLISLRMDWLDLLAVQGTLKRLLQHHSSKASVLQCSAFFIVQLSHPYMTTGKIIALTRWTFVAKVMSLPFNTLSRLVITFLPRSKRLLISWLQSPSAVMWEPKKIKSLTVSIVSPSNFPLSDGTGCHDLNVLSVEF